MAKAAKGKPRRGAAQAMFGHLRSAEGKKSPTTTHAGDKHPVIPGLVRRRGSAARELYPYLASGLAAIPGGLVVAKMLSNAARGSVSPLDGRAKSSEPRKGKR
jgi:hypothetical protein